MSDRCGKAAIAIRALATRFLIPTTTAGTRIMNLIAMAFQPPGPDTRRAAIGGTGSLSVNLRHAFEPVTDFEPVPQPGPHDWLAVHPEPGQMFGQN
jgi:hypothetical protein